LQKIKIKDAGYFKNNNNSNKSGWDYLYMSFKSKDSSMILVKDYEFKKLVYTRYVDLKRFILTNLSIYIFSRSVTQHSLRTINSENNLIGIF